MKAYISIDIEGLPGIASLTMLAPGMTQFKRGEELMTLIAKETAKTLLEKGFERVVVADSHGYMTNINPLDMPRNTTLIQGFPRPLSMVTGLDKTYDAALFLGYHAAAGTLHGFLDHTMSGRVFAEIRINGERASEYLINALIAGENNVPIILVAGDEHLRSEVEKHTPWSVFVVFKKGITRYAAEYDSIEDILARLREGISLATERLKRGEAKPLTFKPPYSVEVYVRDEIIADVLEVMPGITRESAYKLVFETKTASEMLKIIETIAFIGYGVYSLQSKLR